jgi:protein transport protein SEC13
MIHDVQLDYYGKRIATCSSDRTIKIFNNSNQLLQTLLAHQGPVWQVKWAHPKFGSILASCSYDAQVFIWKEQAGKYSVIKEHLIHSSSVNSIDWAPHEIGLVLVSASSDGNLSILTFKDDGSWDVNTLNAHSIGANSVSWAPYNLVSMQESVKRFASGGCDNLIKLWTFQESWKLETTLSGHVDWVRDVAFSSSGVLASCGQDKQVFVWKLNSIF